MNMSEYKIIGKPSCGWCEQAKRLLDSLSIPYEYVDVSQDNKLRFILKAQGITSIPIVYVDNVYIGGYTELKTHIEDINK